MGKNSLRIPREQFASNPNFKIKYPLSLGDRKGNILAYSILIFCLLLFVILVGALMAVTSIYTHDCKCENGADESIFENKCIERGCDWNKKVDNTSVGLFIFYAIVICGLLGGCYAAYYYGIRKESFTRQWEKVRDACITGSVQTKEQVLQCMERVFVSKRAMRPSVIIL